MKKIFNYIQSLFHKEELPPQYNIVFQLSLKEMSDTEKGMLVRAAPTLLKFFENRMSSTFSFYETYESKDHDRVKGRMDAYKELFQYFYDASKDGVIREDRIDS